MGLHPNPQRVEAVRPLSSLLGADRCAHTQQQRGPSGGRAVGGDSLRCPQAPQRPELRVGRGVQSSTSGPGGHAPTEWGGQMRGVALCWSSRDAGVHSGGGPFPAPSPVACSG